MVIVRLVSMLGCAASAGSEAGDLCAAPRESGPGQRQGTWGSRGEFRVRGATVGEALLNVETLVPELRGRLVLPDGSLNPSLFCLLEGGTDVSNGMSVELQPGTILTVGPVVTGG